MDKDVEKRKQKFLAENINPLKEDVKTQVEKDKNEVDEVLKNMKQSVNSQITSTNE